MQCITLLYKSARNVEQITKISINIVILEVLNVITFTLNKFITNDIHTRIYVSFLAQLYIAQQ